MTLPVIPAKAGIQGKQELLDPGFRRGDGFYDFLRDRQILVTFKSVCMGLQRGL